jgi:hypothetical protein
MPVNTSVVFDAARSLLNDEGATIWTDAALLQEFEQAHRELQTLLRKYDCPVMRVTTDTTVNSGTVLLAPTGMIEPIRLWEKATGETADLYIPMTERDPLPNAVVAATLKYWSYFNNTINFIGASANRSVRCHYWKSLSIPSSGGTSIGVEQGELYLTPRTAALANIRIGETEKGTALITLAMTSIKDVILANRGRMPPGDWNTDKP